MLSLVLVPSLPLRPRYARALLISMGGLLCLACSSGPAAEHSGSAPTPGARWAAARSRADVPHPLAARATGTDRGDQITRPAKLTSVETPGRDINGSALRVSCMTCHALRPPAPLPKSPSDLTTFHQGLVFQHGSLVCGSCHVGGKVDTVHLAQGTEIPMTEAMQLCTQCHGPQARDYRHGAHGGMAGAWDRKAGPRIRHHCVECHDPHAPHYVGGAPVLAPIDRGLQETP